jgi:tol-pal system protein YbgF
MRRLLIPAMFLLLATAGCVLTQQSQVTDARLQKLEQRVNEVEATAKDSNEKVQKYSGESADQQVYFESMRDEFAEMKTEYENLKFSKNRTADEYKNLKTYLDERFAKIEKRLIALEKKAGLATASDDVGDALPGTLDAVPVAKKSEADTLQEGILEFKKQKYENARKIFKDFLKRFPTSPKAGDAQFYIGESLFLQKNYADAILAYEDLSSKYSKNPHIPQAILNQAISFEQMGEKIDAKLFFEKVISQFPNSDEAKIAKKKLSLLGK